MTEDPRDPDEVAADLARTLRDLRTELRPRPPRPPTPRELLRFTDEFAIPALVAGLEATIRTLELLQGAIRLVEGRPVEPGDGRETLADTGRATLDRLDGLLSDLADAVEGEATAPEARRLLADTRELRDELDAALDGRHDVRDERPESEPRDVPVDVEGELQSLKDQYDDEDGGK